MSRMHGMDVRAYLGSRDASGDLVSVTPEATAETHDRTVFNNSGWRSFDPGVQGWTCQLEALYQPDAGGIGQQLEAVGSELLLSIYDGDADAIGDAGVLCSAGVLTQRGQPISVADLMKLSGTLQGSGRIGLNGRLLHVLGEETVTGTESSLNNGASSANGGRGNLHVTACTGTWTIKVQHSADNSAWADLVTFTAATGATSESKEVTGTVNQYLRASHKEDVAGSITYVMGFARY